MIIFLLFSKKLNANAVPVKLGNPFLYNKTIIVYKLQETYNISPTIKKLPNTTIRSSLSASFNAL